MQDVLSAKTGAATASENFDDTSSSKRAMKVFRPTSAYAREYCIPLQISLDLSVKESVEMEWDCRLIFAT